MATEDELAREREWNERQRGRFERMVERIKFWRSEVLRLRALGLELLQDWQVAAYYRINLSDASREAYRAHRAEYEKRKAAWEGLPAERSPFYTSEELQKLGFPALPRAVEQEEP